MSEVSLIVFVDASKKAFTAVACLRFERDNSIEVSLVMAKAKVVAVKKLPVPHLELQAAVLGVRLASTVKRSHSINIHKVIFLSDSKTVLSTTYKFVAVRVGEVLDSSSHRRWFYDNTGYNVADDATRWSNTSILQESRWFALSDFL